MIKSGKNPLILVLYFVPSAFYTVFNFLFARKLAECLSLDLWLVQIYIAATVLCGLMLLSACLYMSKIERMSPGRMVEDVGLKNFSVRELLIAVVYFIPFAAFYLLLWNPYVARPLGIFLDGIPLFHIPEWHWQTIGISNASQRLPSGVFIAAMTVLIVSNHLCEEVFFRGFLYRRTEAFFGRYTFIAAGLLFIMHHIFQASRTYPAFPVGIFICGYYARRRNLYGSIFIHLLINLIF